MSDAAMAWARRQRVGGASRKLVLLVLADQADNYGHVSEHCTQTEIAAEAELSERQVRRLLRELSPWFERTHRAGEGGGRQSDTFRLRMKEMPAIVGAKPRQPDKLSAKATGHLEGVNRTPEATGHLPQTPSKILPLQKDTLKGIPKGSPSFDELWTLWRSKDLIRRAKRKPAFETFQRLVRGGANPADIVAGARAYLSQPDKIADGGKFMPDLFRWLRDEVWADCLADAAPNYDEALRIWAASQHTFWDRSKYGPAPNEPGYRSPEDPPDLLTLAGGKP